MTGLWFAMFISSDLRWTIGSVIALIGGFSFMVVNTHFKATTGQLTTSWRVELRLAGCIEQEISKKLDLCG